MHQAIHIAPNSTPFSTQVADLLFEAQCQVETLPDVYRALARIGRLGRTAELLVIVCGDRLTADQLEFFQILSRRYRRCSVYVYGGAGARNKLNAAATHGAQKLLDTNSLMKVIDAWMPAPGPTVLDDDPAADQPIEQVIDEAEARAADPADGDADSTQPVRVPWLRYNDGPLRTPPKRPELPDDSEDEAQERLLSAEELDALIGPNEGENGTDG